MRVISIGQSFLVVIAYRQTPNGDDGGVAFQLIAELPPTKSTERSNQFREIRRVDCFKTQPHEHRFLPTEEEIIQQTAADANRPIDWCIDKLRDAPGFVAEAGYPDLPVNQSDFDEILVAIERTMREIHVKG